jgi:hypothetical protein
MADVVTNGGVGQITALLVASVLKYVGVGTGAGTAAKADTTLFTEAGTRATGAQTQVTTTTTNDTYQVVATVTPGVAAVTNVGIFDATTAGGMFRKADHAVINTAAGDSITYTLKTQFS